MCIRDRLSVASLAVPGPAACVLARSARTGTLASTALCSGMEELEEELEELDGVDEDLCGVAFRLLHSGGCFLLRARG
eukprot:3893321-Alexandrium_andersonii.AAC.1